MNQSVKTIKLVLMIAAFFYPMNLYSRDSLNYVVNGDFEPDSLNHSGNPIIRHMFTADPCALVYDDTLYLFTGHDEQNTTSEWFLMNNWHIFSTTDMINYTDHGAKLSYMDFSWASGNAFAGHCVYKNGKFWWYVPMTHKTIKVNEGFAIGVAVSDRPTGPYTDAIGEALITDETPNSVPLNIDPAVFIDDDGQVYLFWGSWGECRMAKLKDNMTELDGEVQTVNTNYFFEAPWVHKRNGIYYLTYASLYPSKIAYATSDNINGPWGYRGILNDYVENCETNHPSIVQYMWNWYFFYHNGALVTGGNWRRSVCVDLLYYNEDGTMKKIVQTSEGVPEIVAGIEEIGAVTDFQIKLFPNPLNGNSLKIELPGAYADRDIDISIYDLESRLIYKDRISLNTETIAEAEIEIQFMDPIAPGSYILICRSGQLFNSSMLLVTCR
jgi:arabinoxylan arabinofuranohydrolase